MLANDRGKELVGLALGLGVNHDVVVSHLFKKTVTDQGVDAGQKNSL